VKLGFFTLFVEHILRLCENRFLRRIFGSKREEVIEDWRSLYNEGRHNVFASPVVIKVIKSGLM
jgi:hypothetical protein